MSSINKLVGSVLVALLALGGLSACGQAKAQDVSCEDVTIDVTKTQESIAKAEAQAKDKAGTPGEKLAKNELKTLREQLKQLSECDDVALTSSGPVAEEAATWVRLLYANFEGVDETPKEIADWKPQVDLTEVHFYNQEENKESPLAFGPDLGKTPETVAPAWVERIYRDPALALDVARRRGIVAFAPEEQATKVQKLATGPFEDRRELANKVLGWYANPDLVLAIKHYKGKHGSNYMSGNGATSNVISRKDSDVLEARDQVTAEVKSRDRLNCGGQDFVPPKIPPGEQCPPGWPGEAPNCLEPKNPSLDGGGLAPTGGGANYDPGPGIYIPTEEMERPSATPYTPPPSPTPQPSSDGTGGNPTPDPDPEPSPETPAPVPTDPATGGGGCAPGLPC